MAKTRNLTKGNIVKNLIFFAIPLLLSSLVQQLYNTVDLIFVGNMISKSASAAIGASSLLITCLVGFFGGMSVGTGVVVSHIFGAKDYGKLSRAIHNAIAFSLAGGFFLFVVGFLSAPVFLNWIHTPAELHANAVGYLRIYCISFASMFVYNMGSGVLRAVGDSRSPLYAQLAGGLVNVAADYFLIRIMANGVFGVALATLFSQTVAAALTLYRLHKMDSEYAFQFRKIRFSTDILSEVIRIGVPAGIQSLVITLSNVMVQYHINSISEDAIAAFTAYFKVELIIYLPIVAMGQAAMAFAGQCKGADDREGIRKGTKICLLLSIIMTIVISVLALLCGAALFRVFIKEKAVIELGCRIIRISFPFYFLYCILQILGDSLRGCGEVRCPMLIVLMNICLLRTGLLFLIAPQGESVESVASVYPVTWGITAVCMIVYYLHYHKKEIIVQEKRGLT